jgi:hypothetical protein
MNARAAGVWRVRLFGFREVQSLAAEGRYENTENFSNVVNAIAGAKS